MGDDRTLVITSAYCSPIHDGHIDYFELSRELGNYLVAIVNSDSQQMLKRGFIYMNERTRMKVIGALRDVDETFLSVDEDRSVCKSIREVHSKMSGNFSRIIFANGGDRSNNEIPEKKVCDELGIELVDGLGSKINSSSKIIKRVRIYERR